MKFIYIAKKDCKYIIESLSFTKEECVAKIKNLINPNEYYGYVICLVELIDIERELLL